MRRMTEEELNNSLEAVYQQGYMTVEEIKKPT